MLSWILKRRQLLDATSLPCYPYFMQKPPERHIRAIQEVFAVSVLFRKDLVHLPRDILGAGLHIGEHADFDGAVAEGDFDEVARLDGLAGLGDLAVDEDAACIGHLVCYGAALDEPRNFQVFVQSHDRIFPPISAGARRLPQQGAFLILLVFCSCKAGWL